MEKVEQSGKENPEPPKETYKDKYKEVFGEKVNFIPNCYATEFWKKRHCEECKECEKCRYNANAEYHAPESVEE